MPDRKHTSRAKAPTLPASQRSASSASRQARPAQGRSSSRSGGSARPSTGSTPPQKGPRQAASGQRPSANHRPAAANGPAYQQTGRPTADRSSAANRQTGGKRPPSGGQRANGNRAAATNQRPAAQGQKTALMSRRPATPTGRQARPGGRQARPRRRSLRWGRILAALAVIGCLLALVFYVRGSWESAPAADATVAQSVSQPLVSDADKAGFDASINSDSAILINADNGDVLYEKDADTQRAPASLVKMMTVYVAIRHNDDIDRELQMPEAAFENLGDAAVSGLAEGDTVTLRDLLYATILRSGADAANALALATSGNIASFVQLMNEEAAALGLDSTTFTNPTGLDDEAQVSTCRDMARLLKGALGNTTFREILTTRTYTTTPSDTHPDGLILTHTMDKDLTSFQRYFDTSGYTIPGGKTGYTGAAGNCLATLAQKDDAPTYIVVTLHATGTGDQYYQAVHDAVTLYGTAYDALENDGE